MTELGWKEALQEKLPTAETVKSVTQQMRATARATQNAVESVITRKDKVRARVAAVASAVEITISALMLAAIVLVGIRIALEIPFLFVAPDASKAFNVLLSSAFNLIIGVEFIKMLAKHTPGSAIEVLLFAIARQMVVEHTTPMENLIGIVTIALIFAIRKFLFVPTFGEHIPATKAASALVAAPVQNAVPAQASSVPTVRVRLRASMQKKRMEKGETQQWICTKQVEKSRKKQYTK